MRIEDLIFNHDGARRILPQRHGGRRVSAEIFIICFYLWKSVRNYILIRGQTIRYLPLFFLIHRQRIQTSVV